jgi:general secretion pathway protein H
MCQTTETCNESGFTLIEVLVVMALLALVAAASSIWVLNVNDRMVVARVADRVEQMLLRTGSDAVRSGQDRSAKIVGHVLSAPGAKIDLAPDVTLRWTTAMEAAVSDSPTIIFFGTGGASGGTLEISRGSASAAIEIGWLDARVHRAR